MDGRMIREQREKLGMKRPRLAELTGLTVSQIASIENGRALRADEEPRLRQALGEAVVTELQPEVDDGDAPDPMRFTLENPEYRRRLAEARDRLRQLRESRVVIQEVTNLRETEWNGLKTGDPVRVTAPDGDGLLRGTYTFSARVTQPDNEQTWIEVYGGPAGYHVTRSYREDRIVR